MKRTSRRVQFDPNPVPDRATSYTENRRINWKRQFNWLEKQTKDGVIRQVKFPLSKLAWAVINYGRRPGKKKFSITFSYFAYNAALWYNPKEHRSDYSRFYLTYEEAKELELALPKILQDMEALMEADRQQNLPTKDWNATRRVEYSGPGDPIEPIEPIEE